MFLFQLKFHPDDSNTLISGSTDGLINLYDLSEHSEESALRETFNTESSVDTLTWFKADQTDAIACVTHTSDLQLRNIEDAEPYASFGRNNISTTLKVYCIIFDCQKKYCLYQNLYFF